MASKNELFHGARATITVNGAMIGVATEFDLLAEQTLVLPAFELVPGVGEYYFDCRPPERLEKVEEITYVPVVPCGMFSSDEDRAGALEHLSNVLVIDQDPSWNPQTDADASEMLQAGLGFINGSGVENAD